MVLYSIRVFLLGLVALLRPRTDPFEPLVQRFRAWPWYCDQNRHINNAQYLTFMDYGRVAWILRTRFYQEHLRGGRGAFAVGVGMTFRREIRWFSAFELHTRVAAVDGRWMYVEQTFRQDGRDVARGIVRVGVHGRDGFLDLEELWDSTPAPDDDLRTFIAAADAQVRALEAVGA